MTKYISAQHELALCGLFGAAALMLPIIFHIFHIGHIFMPMYLPLVTLAFFVKPMPAAITSFVIPIFSGAVTGMPPFYPPIAVFMALELSIMGALISFEYNRRPKTNVLLILIPILFLGRVLYIAFVYLFALLISLPPLFVASIS